MLKLLKLYTVNIIMTFVDGFMQVNGKDYLTKFIERSSWVYPEQDLQF